MSSERQELDTSKNNSQGYTSSKGMTPEQVYVYTFSLDIEELEQSGISFPKWKKEYLKKGYTLEDLDNIEWNHGMPKYPDDYVLSMKRRTSTQLGCKDLLDNFHNKGYEFHAIIMQGNNQEK